MLLALLALLGVALFVGALAIRWRGAPRIDVSTPLVVSESPLTVIDRVERVARRIRGYAYERQDREIVIYRRHEGALGFFDNPDALLADAFMDLLRVSAERRDGQTEVEVKGALGAAGDQPRPARARAGPLIEPSPSQAARSSSSACTAFGILGSNGTSWWMASTRARRPCGRPWRRACRPAGRRGGSAARSSPSGAWPPACTSRGCSRSRKLGRPLAVVDQAVEGRQRAARPLNVAAEQYAGSTRHSPVRRRPRPARPPRHVAARPAAVVRAARCPASRSRRSSCSARPPRARAGEVAG